MFQEDSDNEINKFTVIGAVKEAYEDFKEKCKEFIQVFIQQMLAHNQTKEKETATFRNASAKVEKSIDDESIQIMSNFHSRKKQVV